MPPVCRAILERLRTPGAAAVFAISLLADAVLLPRGAEGAAIFGGRRGGHDYRYALDLWEARRVGGAIRIVHEDDADEFDVGGEHFTTSNQHISRGVWAPTRRENIVRMTAQRDRFSEAELAHIRAALAARFADTAFYNFDPEAAALINSPGMKRSSTLWTGWARNAVAASALAGLAYSLWSAPGWGARGRRRRRIRRGLCPHCRYDLTGLAEPRCPECGHNGVD